MSFETIDQGRMSVAMDFLPWLRAAGLDTFEQVMTFAGGDLMREFPGRRTVRLQLPAAAGAKQPVYLKRYFPGYLSPARRRLRVLRWPGAQDEAMREWNMIQALRSAGIPTAAPVAVGQHKVSGVVARSFLITAEVPGGVEADRYLKTVAPPERRKLLGAVGRLTRQFHQARFVHKDLYLCHVLVSSGGSAPTLSMIDLQRVVKPCCLSRRWRVKDLAALAYSALKSGASRADLLAAYRVYCGRDRLAASDRSLARAILRRVARLRTRRPKHDADFEQLG